MKASGYKLNGYDATYEKALFDVRNKSNGHNHILEITELNSGITFLVETENNIGGPIGHSCRNKSEKRSGGYKNNNKN